MLRNLNKDFLYDPVYKESLYKRPAGRGLYFAPEAVKRISKTLDVILDSAELQRLHFVKEDPFISLGYHSLGYSAFSQLVGTLFLSDICRAKVSVNGVMLFQWLLDKNLLEEFIICLLLDRMVRFPFDRVVMGEEPFSAVNKGDVIADLLSCKGVYTDAWREKYPNQPNAFQTIHAELNGTFDIQSVIQVIKQEESVSFDLKVLQAFVSGGLKLSRTDRVMRLAFGSARNFDSLNIDVLYQDIEINEQDGRVGFHLQDDEIATQKQLLLFYTTYHGLLVPEVVFHQDSCFARGLFRKCFNRYVELEKKSGRKDSTIIANLLFMNDMDLWHEMLSKGIADLKQMLCGVKWANCCFTIVPCGKESVQEIVSRVTATICQQMKLRGEDLVVDTATPRPTDSVWHLPEIFPSIAKHATPTKLKKIADQKESCRLAFFTLKEVDDIALKRYISETIGK